MSIYRHEKSPSREPYLNRTTYQLERSLESNLREAERSRKYKLASTLTELIEGAREISPIKAASKKVEKLRQAVTLTKTSEKLVKAGVKIDGYGMSTRHAPTMIFVGSDEEGDRALGINSQSDQHLVIGVYNRDKEGSVSEEGYLLTSHGAYCLELPFGTNGIDPTNADNMLNVFSQLSESSLDLPQNPINTEAANNLEAQMSQFIGGSPILHTPSQSGITLVL